MRRAAAAFDPVTPLLGGCRTMTTEPELKKYSPLGLRPWVAAPRYVETAQRSRVAMWQSVAQARRLPVVELLSLALAWRYEARSWPPLGLRLLADFVRPLLGQWDSLDTAPRFDRGPRWRKTGTAKTTLRQ